MWQFVSLSIPKFPRCFVSDSLSGRRLCLAPVGRSLPSCLTLTAGSLRPARSQGAGWGPRRAATSPSPGDSPVSSQTLWTRTTSLWRSLLRRSQSCRPLGKVLVIFSERFVGFHWYLINSIVSFQFLSFYLNVSIPAFRSFQEILVFQVAQDKLKSKTTAGSNSPFNSRRWVLCSLSLFLSNVIPKITTNLRF